MKHVGTAIAIPRERYEIVLEGTADEFVWMEAGQITNRTRELQPAEAR